MKIGISTHMMPYYGDPSFTARKVEELGFESIWYAEHIVFPVQTTSRTNAGTIREGSARYVDPFIALAMAACATKTLKLGTGIALVPIRSPLHLANEVSTLDLFSGGRFLFGIGGGWLKEETDIMGGDWEHRWTQVREAIEVMKALWTNEEAEHHGKYYKFPPVKSYPKPAQKPHPPIILGGTAKNVLKRVVAYGDGWMPSSLTPNEIIEARTTLDTLAIGAGRDPASISITVYVAPQDNLDLINASFEAGVDRIILSPETAKTQNEVSEELERLAEVVLQ